MNKSLMPEEDFTFRMRKLTAVLTIDRGLKIDPKRVQFEILSEHDMATGQRLISALLNVATQEETIAEVPDTWFDHLKQDICQSQWWMKHGSKVPRFIKNKLAWKSKWVVAVHKFPELDPPESVLGHEYVHLKVVDPWKLQDSLFGKEGN